MGGHIMSILGGQYDNLVDGMIFSSPLICDYEDFIKFDINKYNSEFYLVPVPNNHDLSHDYDFIQSYDNDEVVLNKVTVGLYHALKTSSSHILEYLYKFKYIWMRFYF